MDSSTSVPSSFVSTATVWWTLYPPAGATLFSVPFRLGGTMILWSTTGVSGTVPMMSPPTTLSPALATGVKSHSLSGSMGGTSTPRGRLLPWTFSMIFSSGRWMPS